MLHLETESEDVYLPRVSWISLENPVRWKKNNTRQAQRDYLFVVCEK
jgi:hypothetical protein